MDSECVLGTSNYSADYWSTHTIREIEKRSIELFVKQNSKYLEGRVLDFGAGKPGTCAKPQPYKQYIKGEYVPIDEGDMLPKEVFDAVLCTQVLQYMHKPPLTFNMFKEFIRPGGHLVLTYPTSWDEVEQCDLWRFTKSGVEQLCKEVKLVPIKHERRAHIELKGFKFPLGYGLVARNPGKYSLLDADESANLLTEELKQKRPFIYVRYGDGAIECINKLGAGRTCDGEVYTDALAKDLKDCWEVLMRDRFNQVYIGDWLSASFDDARSGEYAPEYTSLVGVTSATFLHFEALLFMRRSQHLINFYKVLADDTRTKVYLGPAKMSSIKDLLKCKYHIVTPMVPNLYEHIGKIEEQLNSIDFDILIYGAGMSGNIPVIRNWKKFPERTYIHIGSALDPIGLGRTRKTQLTTQQLKQDLYGLL